MSELQLTLTTQERDYLTSLLREILKEKLVEEHRTRTLSYRGFVVHEEETIKGLLRKMGQEMETAKAK
jgi:hypothetical protein